MQSVDKIKPAEAGRPFYFLAFHGSQKLCFSSKGPRYAQTNNELKTTKISKLPAIAAGSIAKYNKYIDMTVKTINSMHPNTML